MAYSQVNPQIDNPDINPADRNSMAIQAGYTGYEDYLNNRASTQGGGATSADEMFAQIQQQLMDEMDKFTARVKEFDENNPFTFDEILAQSSAEERYNPYYEAELSDFVAGIDTRRKTVEGERDLLVELNRVQMGENARRLDEAVKASEEGYAGAGLFFSGERERATGLTKIGGIEQTERREAQFGRGQEQAGLQLGSIATQEATGRRQTEAARTTDIQTEIEKLRAEERARHEHEKAQYIGFPYTLMKV